MRPDVQEYGFFFFLIEKLKQNTVALVYRKAPFGLEFAVESVGIKTSIERVESKQHDTFIC